jgi:hypothetical protein
MWAHSRRVEARRKKIPIGALEEDCIGEKKMRGHHGKGEDRSG